MGDARATIARLKAAAAGDARAFESMTVRATASRRARDAMRARERRRSATDGAATDGAANRQADETRAKLTRSREIAAEIRASLERELARARTLAEACARSGTPPPDAPATDDASATTDASREALDASASEADDDESTLEGARRALARSQARARIELAEARRARARADAMADALRRAGVDAPPA
jgi:hypothetical protein